MNNKSSKKEIVILIFFFIFTTGMFSQILPSNINELSDTQLKLLLKNAQSKGYTLQQIKSLAVAEGLSNNEIEALESRMTSTESTPVKTERVNNELEVVVGIPAGLTGTEAKTNESKPSLFGYDFFNNQNITFTPNLNLSAPETYQLGPGDEIVINLWGAAENNYILSIDREGVLRIPNAGPVYLNGVTLKEAKSKIKNKLKRIYGGISATNNSPYKINVSVTLAKVRTVQVNIIGEVKVPGSYTLNSLSTVLNALYASGGPTKQGTFRQVKLVRNGEEVQYFDIYKYLLSGDQTGNSTLKDQDVIIVSPYVSRITIGGAIKRPGIFELMPNEKFGDLLSYVSGFTANAYKEIIGVERIENDRKVYKEFGFNNLMSQPLKDGDVVNVKSTLDRFENKLTIEGAVNRSGAYEFKEGMTLLDLIEKASGLNKSAYTNRGIIYREVSPTEKKAIPFSLEKVLNGEQIQLQNGDQIRIFNSNLLSTNKTININGAVKNPNAYNYYTDITIEDLILMAGGFLENANPDVIDVYRKINDDEFETLSLTYKIGVDGGLTYGNDVDFKLQPYDQISIRSLKGYNNQKGITVEGEVNYPGRYRALNENDRISDILKLAGGLSPYAFVEGATLIRLNPYYKEKGQQNVLNNINENNIEDLDIKNRKEFRVGINLKEILSEKGENSKYNLVIKPGDKIIIPSIKETVKTEGEVIVPSLIVYQKGLTLKSYVNGSGGFSTKAKKGKTYVVYPNGDIKTTKRFLFFKSYPEITPGAIVLVPEKPERNNPITLQQGVSAATGITALALLVDRLLN